MAERKTPKPEARLVFEAELASAFAHPLRLRVLRRLSCDPCCVGDLVELAGVDQPKVSRHLAVLRKLGLVSCRVEGRRRCYSLLKPDLIEAVLAALDGVPSPDADPPTAEG